MSSNYRIARADRSRAAAVAIQQVEHETLGDSPYSVDELLQVLRRPEHLTFLAYHGATLVGFCSCIQTPLDTGWRLEIDMLGVLEAHRRQGIGKALLRAAVDEARQAGASALRGVVAVDNVASQRAFHSAGLEQFVACDLMIYEIEGAVSQDYLPPGWRAVRLRQGSVPSPDGQQAPWSADGAGRSVHRLLDAASQLRALVQTQEVHTLAYRGVWIERLWGGSDKAAALAARAVVESAKSLDLDEVGYLLPQEDDLELLRMALVREGFQAAGTYLVYTASAHSRASTDD